MHLPWNLSELSGRRLSSLCLVDVSGWRNSFVLDYVCAKSLQSCPTPCDPVGRSPPGSSVHGILQERTLERAARPFSRGSSRPGDSAQLSHVSRVGRQILYRSLHLGSPSVFDYMVPFQVLLGGTLLYWVCKHLLSNIQNVSIFETY